MNTIYMKVENFNILIKYMKTLKSEYCAVLGNQMIAMNEGFSLMRYLELPFSVEIPFTLISSNVTTEFLSNITDTIIEINIDGNYMQCINNPYRAESSVYEFNQNIYATYTKILQQIQYMNIHVWDFGSIDDDPDFVKLKSQKAAEGLVVLNKNGYPISLVVGLLPVNKGDTVSLRVIDQGKEFIAEFTIYKKSIKCNMISWLRYLKY